MLSIFLDNSLKLAFIHHKYKKIRLYIKITREIISSPINSYPRLTSYIQFVVYLSSVQLKLSKKDELVGSDASMVDFYLLHQVYVFLDYEDRVSIRIVDFLAYVEAHIGNFAIIEQVKVGQSYLLDEIERL